VGDLLKQSRPITIVQATPGTPYRPAVKKRVCVDVTTPPETACLRTKIGYWFPQRPEEPYGAAVEELLALTEVGSWTASDRAANPEAFQAGIMWLVRPPAPRFIEYPTTANCAGISSMGTYQISYQLYKPDTGDWGIYLANILYDRTCGATCMEYASVPGETHQECHLETVTPAVPATPGTPGTSAAEILAAKQNHGFNAGARSVATLIGDGEFRFTVAQPCTGAVVGISNEDPDTRPETIAHGFFIYATNYRVIEHGVYRTLPGTCSADTVFVLRRKNGQVTYHVE